MGNTTTKQTPLTKKLTTNNNKTYEEYIRMDFFQRKLDDKRRLTMPTELRQEFSSGIVLTRGFGDYLHLYPQKVWEREVEPALSGNILDEEVADINVKFRRGKTTADLDHKQGRVTIEQHLLDYAGITKEIVAVRAGAYWRVMRADHPNL